MMTVYLCRNNWACVCVCGAFVFMLFSSPAEELSFGSVDTERKSLIVLSNVAKNKVAFKVSVMLLFWVCDTQNVDLTGDGAGQSFSNGRALSAGEDHST